MSEHLDPKINELIQEQQEKGGIDITTLEPGTKIEVQTRNSTYKIKVLNPGKKKIEIQGGLHITEPEEAFLTGSTWGGSMLKMGWIGYMMCMEVHRPQRLSPLLTSLVRAAKVIGPDWEYDLAWENEDGETETT